MSKTAQAIILGVVVAVVVSAGLSLLLGMAGETHNGSAIVTGFFVGAFTAYIFGNLAGNRSIADAGDAEKAAALNNPPPPGKALLFVYREGFVAKLAGLNIDVDGKTVAQLKSPRFTRVVVEPGPHTVSAKFGGLAGAQSLPGECQVIALPDGMAAVRIGMRMGALKNGISLEPQSDMGQVKACLAGMPMTPADVPV